MDQDNAGGYKYTFINKPAAHLYCNSCEYVARKPTITSCCGRCFCQSCIGPTEEERGLCPYCHKQVTETMYQSFYEETVLNLKVECPNKVRKCKWEGLLKELDDHLNETKASGCLYVEIPCDKGCGMKVARGFIDIHFNNDCMERQFACQYCNKQGTYRSISTEHWSECAYMPVQCPNMCGVTCEQSDLERHLKMCELSVIPCFYQSAGCEAEFQRKDEEDHLKEGVQHHLNLTMTVCQELKQKNEATRSQYEKELHEQAEEFAEMLNAAEKKQAEVFESHEKKLHALYHEYETKLQNMRLRFETVLRIKDEGIRVIRENMDSAIDSRVRQSIESFKLESGIPPYNLTMTNYQSLKTKTDIWYSPRMLTHPQGYTIIITVRPNGYMDTKDKSVGVWLRLVKGNQDSYLKWPAKVTITLQLLNQHRDHDHVTITEKFELRRVVDPKVNHVCISAFSETFISPGALEYNGRTKTQYLKDDCLKFRVTMIRVH